MTEIRIVNEMDVDGSYLIEGLPGVGLVAKIVSDYLIDQLDMELYAEVYGDDLPDVPVFHHDEHGLTAPVRIFASSEHGVTTLQSDVLFGADVATFIAAISDWMEGHGMHPIYQVGIPVEFPGDSPHLFGVTTGTTGRLEDTGITPPPIDGGVAGPTGALLEYALEHGIDASGLIVESDAYFPDPAAARTVIDDGIEPLTGLDIETDMLTESAGQIRDQKEELAKRVQDMMDDRSNQAFPREMYH